jgi:hypothetical protein
MIESWGGTRAIMAYLLVLAFIASIFVPSVTEARFAALATMATTAVAFYYSNKATMDQPSLSDKVIPSEIKLDKTI